MNKNQQKNMLRWAKVAKLLYPGWRVLQSGEKVARSAIICVQNDPSTFSRAQPWQSEMFASFRPKMKIFKWRENQWVTWRKKGIRAVDIRVVEAAIEASDITLVPTLEEEVNDVTKVTGVTDVIVFTSAVYGPGDIAKSPQELALAYAKATGGIMVATSVWWDNAQKPSWAFMVVPSWEYFERVIMPHANECCFYENIANNVPVYFYIDFDLEWSKYPKLKALGREHIVNILWECIIKTFAVCYPDAEKELLDKESIRVYESCGADKLSLHLMGIGVTWTSTGALVSPFLLPSMCHCTE